MKGQREPGEKGKGLSPVKMNDWFYQGRKEWMTIGRGRGKPHDLGYVRVGYYR